MPEPSNSAQPTRDPSGGAQNRAFLLGVVNGAVFQMGISFTDPTTVLPAFVNQLTHSALAVGAISAIGSAGWLVPQLLVAHYVQGQPRKLGVYRVTTAIRIGAMLALTVTMFMAGGRAALTFASLAIFYALFCLGGGAASVPFFDIVAKTIPPNRIGSFFGRRQMYGGMLALVSAVVVRQVLRHESVIGFPRSYAYLFALGTVAIAVSLIMYAMVDEPPSVVDPRPRPSLATSLREAGAVLAHDRDFRNLFITGVLLGVGAMATAFFTVFTQAALRVPPSMIGVYLGFYTAGTVISNLVWAPISDRYGGRRTMIPAAVVWCATLLSAMALTMLPLPAPTAGWAFCAVFLLYGCGVCGTFIASYHYLLEVAPETQRPVYIGAYNTFSTINVAMPLLGGLLVRAWSYQGMFALAAAAGAAGLVRAVGLRDLGGQGDTRFGQRRPAAAGADGASPEI